MRSQTAQGPYFFADFQLDPLRRVLLKGGEPVSLNPKAVELLLVLVEKRTEVLSKNDLLGTVWPDQIVEENNLTVHVSALRKALGDRNGQRQFIVTIPGRGYQFVADVRHSALSDALVVEHHSVTRITVEEEDEDAAKEPLAISIISRNRSVIAGAACALLLACGGFVMYRYFSRQKAVVHFSRFEITRQTNSGRVLTAVVSPDGRYITYAQSEADGQSLWLRHVPTGSQNRIVEPQPVAYWGLSFTPDNNYIYATTFEKSQADPVLSKYPVLGGVVERLPVVTNTGVSFSPDGRRMAYVVSSSSSNGSILWTANADGSDPKLLALQKDPNFFAMEGNTVAWSPDGETIACAVVENSGDGLNMSVVGYNVRDGKPMRLTRERWNIITGLAWTAHKLVFTGNKQPGLPSQVWLVSQDGGETRRVTNDLNNYRGVSMKGDSGALVTVQTQVTSGIWTAKVSGDGAGDFKSEYSEVGNIPAAAWTMNGELAYVSIASGAPELWLLKPGDRARQLTIDSRISDFAVSPDGRYIVMVSNRDGGPNLWRIDMNGAGFKQLTSGAGEVRPRFGPDGKVVYFQKGFGNVRSSVWSVSIEGNDLRQLTEPHQIYPDVSPDGKHVIYSYMHKEGGGAGQWRLGLANLEDGRQIQSFEVPGSVTNRLTRWMTDNSGFLYISTTGGVSNVWLQPLDGGVARPVTNFSVQQIETFDLSRDRALAVVRSHKANDAVLLVDGS